MGEGDRPSPSDRRELSIQSLGFVGSNVNDRTFVSRMFVAERVYPLPYTVASHVPMGNGGWFFLSGNIERVWCCCHRRVAGEGKGKGKRGRPASAMG